MSAFDFPTSEAQAVEAVQAALCAKTPLRLMGGGTRAALGRPVAAAKGLSSAKLSGITLYEPSEMVIGAKAGTPLAEIEAALAEKGQMLSFEPMDHRALLGGFFSQTRDTGGKPETTFPHPASGVPTIGAIAAGNISGPRRIMAGAARDSLIGVRYVNGRGEAIKSGGRVMKNVTGLDLVKFQAGAFGTLGFLTEVIFRVVPKAPTSAVLVIEGLDDARAIDTMSTGLTSPFEVTGAVHCPADIEDGGKALTFLRIEGFAESIAYRTRALRHMLAAFGSVSTLDAEEGAAAFANLRDGKPLAAQGGAIWRLSVKPSLAAQAVAAVRAQRSARAFYDWGGGLIWLATGLEGDAGAAAIRMAAKAAEGYATLIRAPEALRAVVPVFEPESAPLAALTQRVKLAADPAGIFNPGLMFAGL